MKNRNLFLLTFIVLFISTQTFAQPFERQKKRMQENQELTERFKNRFENRSKPAVNFFTDEQKEAIKSLRIESAKELKPLKNEIRELMARQQTLTTADSPDTKAIEKNIDKMAEVKAEMTKIRAKQHQEIRKLLTDEQLLRFDSMHDRKANMHRQNRPDFQRNQRI